MDLRRYIKEWLAIENIATKKYGQKYLTEIEGKDGCDNLVYSENNDDDDSEVDSKIPPCTERKNLKGDPCDTYYSVSKKKRMCVTKSRIHGFDKGEIIKGKDDHTYEIIDLDMIGKEEDDTGSADIFYIVFLSKKTGDIILLFPTGRTFKGKIDTYDFLTDHFRELIQKIKNTWIKRLTKPNHRLVIGGHSMGGSLSLYLAMMLHKEEEKIFNDKCVVACSAPFRMIDEDNAVAVNFRNLPNVMVFAWCYPPHEDDFSRNISNGKMILEETITDCFLEKGVGNYNYSPITYFTNPTKCSSEALEILQGSGALPIGVLPVSDKTYVGYLPGKKCHAIHVWENYYPALCAMYPYENVKQDFISPTEDAYIKKKKGPPPMPDFLKVEEPLKIEEIQKTEDVPKIEIKPKSKSKSKSSSNSEDSIPKTRIGRILKAIGLKKSSKKKATNKKENAGWLRFTKKRSPDK